MKKKIAILGSTGSIGKSTIEIIRKDKKNFEVILLTTNNNYKEILKQALEFKPRNLVINNSKSYLKLKKKLKNKKINIYNSINGFNRRFKNKIDFTMSAISGLDGLKPTLDLIKFTKNLGIANKESIICGWNLIQNKIKKYKTEFIPIDSEHFSIWSLLDKNTKKNVEQIIITASGGPFLKLPLSKFKKIKPSNAIKHPNWKMGNKISIDSSTLMNKVFEVIEAQRIFNIDINKFKVLTHPSSYVHAIVKFHNGLTKILLHDTDMKIPIINSIYNRSNINFKNSKLNLNVLNNLNFAKIDSKKFPSIKIINMIPKKISLYETVLVSANDQLVDLFLKNKISFQNITIFLNKILRMKIFKKYKRITPKNYKEIIALSHYVRLKTRLLCI